MSSGAEDASACESDQRAANKCIHAPRSLCYRANYITAKCLVSRGRGTCAPLTSASIIWAWKEHCDSSIICSWPLPIQSKAVWAYGVISHDETCNHYKQMKFVVVSVQTRVSRACHLKPLLMNTWQTEARDVMMALGTGRWFHDPSSEFKKDSNEPLQQADRCVKTHSGCFHTSAVWCLVRNLIKLTRFKQSGGVVY